MSPIPRGEASLLLLPALTSSSTPSSISSAYKTTLETLLPKLINKSSPDAPPTRLDIAIAISETYPSTSPTDTPRAAIFPTMQHLLSSIYSLVVSTAARLSIDLDFPGGIDVRAFILEPRVSSLPQSILGKQSLTGPIVDVPTFVKSSRPYTTLYAVDGEAGEQYLKQLITAYNASNSSPPALQRLPSGPAILHSSSPTQGEQAPIDDRPLRTHTSVAVGGTFDHLHIGHKLLLTGTILAADPSTPSPRIITVGITGDELLVNKKFGTVVESWEVRQQRTAEFVESVLVFHADVSGIKKVEEVNDPGPNGRVVRVTYSTTGGGPGRDQATDQITINYTQISDPYGPTITDEDISAIVISAETRAGGGAVNTKRGEKGWKALEVFEVDILDAGAGDHENESQGPVKKEGFESKISSTEIRRRLWEREQQGK